MKCNCGHVNRDQAKFCELCGSKIKVDTLEKCNECGYENTTNSIFCSGCGKSLGKSEIQENVNTKMLDEAESNLEEEKEMMGIVTFFSNSGDSINVECAACGRVLKIPAKDCITKAGEDTKLLTPHKCICGIKFSTIQGKIKEEVVLSEDIKKQEKEVLCPKCKSNQITAQKKGFGLGNAAIGGVLLGPLGLLGGIVGSGDIVVTCLKCGNKWKPIK